MSSFIPQWLMLDYNLHSVYFSATFDYSHSLWKYFSSIACTDIETVEGRNDLSTRSWEMIRTDRFMHHRVKLSSFSTTALSTRQLLAYWKFHLLAPLLSQQPNSSHFHVAKIRDDETGHRDSRVVFQAYRLPRRSCHRCRKQYFLNRPYKPAINFPRPSRNFPNTSSLLLGFLNTVRDISMALKS